MNKQELFEQIKGQMIISCQAIPGEPLYVEGKICDVPDGGAAKMAGTPAIRTSSIRDVAAIKGGDRTSGYRTGKDPVSRL